MADVAKKITQIGPPEQVSEQKPDEKPWLRQKNEPAAWYMRFRRYLDMGTKRSLRAVVANEPQDEKATKGNKKQAKNSEQKNLSEISVPGSWSRAAKVWNWKARAEAYDLAEISRQAVFFRGSANKARFASKAYRILQLDSIARLLRDQIKPGMALKWCLALTARYQSVMRDLAAEMEGLDGVTIDACDAAAFAVIKQEIEENSRPKRQK
jgi:hypothetical protein